MRLNRPAVQVALAKVQHEHREVHWQKCEQFFFWTTINLCKHVREAQSNTRLQYSKCGLRR